MQDCTWTWVVGCLDFKGGLLGRDITTVALPTPEECCESFFGNKRERPRQWHNKGASSTRAQAAGPPPIPRVPRARTNEQGS
jgi:hypothetical protein